MESVVPPPAALPGDDDQERFDHLQARLIPLWASIGHFSADPQTIVVVPSISIDAGIQGIRQQALEERYLFLLLLLRQPRARLVYVTSQAIHADVVDYYLDLLPGVFSGHARKRLFLVSPLDGSPEPLTHKLLRRPRLLEYIRSLIPDRHRAHLVPFNTTGAERELALKLDIPMYGADPRCFALGTKSGARKIFAEEGIPHPLGVEDLGSIEELAGAIASMRVTRPRLEQVVVKLNEGVSGGGNAGIDLAGLPAPGAPGERAAILERVRRMAFESPQATYDAYVSALGAHGAVVEERIVGRQFRSPSAQLRVTPLGVVEALSTHDQVLGGPSGQAYLGCRFPASPAYAAVIMREAMKVGRRLRDEGVLGRFAIDFVAVLDERGVWDIYAIEINLRKGGTTHPFLTLQFLTDGTYDADAGVFRTPRGEPKCFVASDHVHSPAYRAFTHVDLFDLVARHGLHFDQARQTGVVFHMLNGVGELGTLGVTAVGNSTDEADAIYGKTIEALDAEAPLAGRPAGDA